MNDDRQRIDAAKTAKVLEALISTLQVNGSNWEYAQHRLNTLRHAEATNPRWNRIAAVASILACIIALLAWVFPRDASNTTTKPPSPSVIAPILPSKQPASSQTMLSQQLPAEAQRPTTVAPPPIGVPSPKASPEVKSAVKQP